MADADDPLRLLEALFLQSYRRELEQEENVWRSLPFFSAFLALEVAAASAAVASAPELDGPMIGALGAAIGLLATTILLVLVHLRRSIGPETYQLIADEEELLHFAGDLEAARGVRRANALAPAFPDAVAGKLRESIVRQLAAVTPFNRELNERRSRARARAGGMLLVSFAATLLVVGLTLGYHLYRHEDVRRWLDGSPPVERVDPRRDAGAGPGRPPAAPR